MKRLLFAFSVACLMLVSCSKKEPETETVFERRIAVLSSIGGMGDHGYNDLAMSGIFKVHEEIGRDRAHVLYFCPKTMDEAELFVNWWAGTNSRTAEHTLLVLCSSDYRTLADKFLSDKDFVSENEVDMLVFEVPELPVSQNRINASSFTIDMSGASYDAGLYAGGSGSENPLIWIADKSDGNLSAAADAFADAYASLKGKKPERRFLSDDWHGFSMEGEVYAQMEDVCGQNDFIFPLMGGSEIGIYRYLLTHPEGPAVVGMDVDRSLYSNNNAGNILKHIDAVLHDILLDWLDGKPIEHYRKYDKESGYIEWCPVSR